MGEQGDPLQSSMVVALRSPRSTTAAPQRPPRAHHPSKRASANGVVVALGRGNARRHQSTRPATSPHATHAMVLQLQEYHDRLEKACGSTYQFALQPPPRGDRDGEDAATSSSSSPRKKGYCRARLLQSSRPATSVGDSGSAPPPAFSTRVGVKDCVLPAANVYVAFHQTTPRCSEYLYGTNQESARRMRLLDSMASAAGVDGASSSVVVTKDHVALGPGQYDVQTATSGAAGGAKFSPSDRFHESYSTDQPGPGQYLTSEALVSPRAAAAVFSQRPRETDLGALVSPTANVVSSYYYVPESTFDAVASASGRAAARVGWSRTARFKSSSGSRHDRALLQRPPRPSTTDFVARNMAAVQQAHGGSARVRRGRHTHREGGDGDSDALRLALERRSSLVASLTSYRRATQATVSSASKGIAVVAPAASSSALLRLRSSVSSREHVDVLLQSWITIAYMASFQRKLERFRGLLAALGRLRDLQARTRLSVTFRSWQKLDVNRNRQYAAQLIARNTVRLRLWLRIEKKRRHASRLRQFLRGLSFDVRFALSMKRIKRKIVAIQRWWRHVQLMVRAREEALYHKWLAVETHMRLEYVNQLPHLQRIFTPPAGTAAAAANAPSGAGGASFSAHGNAHASDLQLHKLLNLPDQRRWFPGKFVLSSDGSLRGFVLDSNELLVEIRNFRCHYHDVSAGGADDAARSGNGHHHHRLSVAPIDTRASYTSYTNATWKPFLMLFRQGAFRFVVITSLSPLPTEILSWKDKLERLMVNPTSSFAASGASFSGGSASSSYNDLSFFSSVSDFVEVSMQSGILAPALTSEGHSGNNSNGHRPSKFQARVRSIRQRTKSGVNVAEGSLSYYVVDLLKDLPKVPTALVWATIREKLREKRKAFRAEIYRYKLEMFHYQEHQQHVKHMHVLAKFRDFFTLERPRRPHFRSLISNRKMEAIIRATAEQVKASTPSNPRLLLDSSTLKQ